jgi:ELWxxDGT repeat protein
MAIYKNRLYFPGRSNYTDAKLMVYDGINPPGSILSRPNGSGAIGFVSYGSSLYFVDDSAASYPGYLYRYFGVGAPVQIGEADIVPGNWPDALAPYKGKIYFSKVVKGLGSEFGAYDTATGQMSLVAEINPGPGSSSPRQFLVYGDKLYFVAGDDLYGDELYSYDGATLKRLTDVRPGPDNGATFTIGLGTMAAFKGAIYFSGMTATNHHALFRYDTATQKASLAFDPAAGITSFGYPAGIFAMPNNVYFYYNHPTTGLELYQYDGSSGKLVADLNPGKPNGAGFSNMVRYGGNYLYFCGNSGESGPELYRIFDGIPSGIENVTWGGAAFLHPNPANADATLSITLPIAQNLVISLTDISGREVFSTGRRSFSSGKNEVVLPMEDLAAGQYFYRISGGKGETLASGTAVKQ